jgi:hypothetical protein
VIRYSPHGALADYLAYAVNRLLLLHNTPVVRLAHVSKQWLLNATHALYGQRGNVTDLLELEEHLAGLEDRDRVPISVQSWSTGSTLYHGEDSLPYVWHLQLQYPRSFAAPPQWRPRLLELSDAALFDFVIANPDRFHPMGWSATPIGAPGHDPIAWSRARVQQIHYGMDRFVAPKRLCTNTYPLSLIVSPSRLLDSYNMRTMFPGGPLVLIDHSDSFLNASGPA